MAGRGSAQLGKASISAALVFLSACQGLPKTAVAAVDPAACEAAVRYSEQHNGVALLVFINGEVACEAYSGGLDRDAAHALYSGTKGLNALMAAAAAADGFLSLDEPVADTLTEWRADPLKSKMTIRHLLSLSSGLATTGPRAAPGYAGAAATPAAAAPGATFAYGPIVFQTFGAVMTRKLAARGGETPTAYLQRRVLDPIGARIERWGGPTAGPDPNLAAGAFMSAKDWARVGDLLLRPEVTRQAKLDAGVVAAMGQPQGAYAGYGLSWWLATPLPASAREGLDPVARTIDLPQGAFAGRIPADLVVGAGAGGQRLYVSRSRKLVAVRFADVPDLATRFARAQETGAAGRAEAAVGGGGFSDTELVAAILQAAT